MPLKDQLKADLIKDEGTGVLCGGFFVVYDDATGQRIIPGYTLKGHPTIGFGRALDRRGLSFSEANALLDNDCDYVIDNCSRIFPWFSELNTVRQRVIANMVFQLGFTGFMQFHTMIDCIEHQEWKSAFDAGLSSQWAKETPDRAATLMQWLFTGTDGSALSCPQNGT